MNNYKPPFSMTNKMLDYISSIMEKIGKLDNYKNLNKMPILRRNNKIKSIHSSLAIEANSLSLNQVKDVIAGKAVLGPQKEIQEVKNAYKAYDMIKGFNPYSKSDLKKAHGIMTYLTVEESGKFRTGEEGVFGGDVCIHICPKPEMVDSLISDLFEWMKKNKDQIHPLILSSVFHYEFVFIHPFSDGNGRIARLWQNAILSNWKDIFEYIPIESELKKYQNDYYDAINKCNNKLGDSTIFVEFMLRMFDEVLYDFINNTSVALTEEAININKLLDVMEINVPMTANEIMEKLGIKSKETLRSTYLNPAIKEGLVMQTIPGKPTSKKQMYYRV